MSVRFLQSLDHFADFLRTHCERKKYWFLAGISALYMIITCLLASRRLLWNDELFTLYTSRLPSFSDIWNALLTGADQIPPLFHLITRASFFLFGINELSVRLPAILGFWLMSICLFHFVSKRSSALYGFAAMLFPLVTGAYDYAYEARSYGLILGFGGLAFVCWQATVNGRYRVLSLCGLAISLATALSIHYYAVLLFFPLALGEMVRTLLRRRVDIAVWIAFGVAMSVLFLYLPLIEHSRTYSEHTWSVPNWMMLPGFYFFLLAPAILPLAAALIVAAMPFAAKQSVSILSNQEDSSNAELPELAAALGFIALPVVAMILAKLIVGAFTYRYALPAVIGFSILFAFAAYRMSNGRALVGIVFVLTLFFGFLFLGVRSFVTLGESARNLNKTYEFIRAESKGTLPIAVSDLHNFMLLAYYAPKDISPRLVYLADPKASLRYLGHTTVDQGILDLKNWFRLNVEEYEPYIASHHQFIVYNRLRGERSWVGCYWGLPWDLSWLIFQLTEDKMRMELRGRNNDAIVFLVSH